MNFSKVLEDPLTIIYRDGPHYGPYMCSNEKLKI